MTSSLQEQGDRGASDALAVLGQADVAHDDAAMTAPGQNAEQRQNRVRIFKSQLATAHKAESKEGGPVFEAFCSTATASLGLGEDLIGLGSP